jgi:flagellar motor switch protein FliN/FliY
MNEIENFDIRTPVIASVTETFETMLSMPVQLCETEPDDSTGVSRMVGTVKFAGDVVGMINFQVTTEMSRLMSASMLDIAPENIEGDEEIKNLISKIVHIIGGNLKSSLNDSGLTCEISTPTITFETDFTIKSPDMERFERLVFQHESHSIFVEIDLNSQQASSNDNSAGKKPASATPEEEGQGSPPPPDPAAEKKDPGANHDLTGSEDFGLDLLLDVPLELKVELGRARIQIHDLLKLSAGSAVKLIKLEGDPVDILVNDILIARGEVVVQNEKYGIRITEITGRMDRIRSFGI